MDGFCNQDENTMNFRGVAAASLLAAFGCADAVATPNQDLLLFNGSHFVGATVDMNFATGQYFGLSPSQLTVSRASSEYEMCNGTLYGPFAANALAVTPCGGWIWEARTNLFLNNNAPATQTIAVTSGAYYSISFYGTGTLTLSGACATTMTGAAFPARTAYSCQASTTSLTATVTALGAMQWPQVEANPNATSVGGSFATGPILTGGGEVTRAATVVTSGPLPVNPNAFSLFAAATALGPQQTNYPGVIEIDGASANAEELFSHGSANIYFSGFNNINTTGVVIAIGTPFKYAVGASPSLYNTSLNGATAPGSTTAPAVPLSAPTSLRIGSRQSSGVCDCLVSRIAVFGNAALTQSQLNAVTH